MKIGGRNWIKYSVSCTGLAVLQIVVNVVDKEKSVMAMMFFEEIILIQRQACWFNLRPIFRMRGRIGTDFRSEQSMYSYARHRVVTFFSAAKAAFRFVMSYERPPMDE